MTAVEVSLDTTLQMLDTLTSENFSREARQLAKVLIRREIFWLAPGGPDGMQIIDTTAFVSSAWDVAALCAFMACKRTGEIGLLPKIVQRLANYEHEDTLAHLQRCCDTLYPPTRSQSRAAPESHSISSTPTISSREIAQPPELQRIASTPRMSTPKRKRDEQASTAPTSSEGTRPQPPKKPRAEALLKAPASASPPKPRVTRQGGSNVLESKDIKGLARYIKSGSCKNICVLFGAGVSTAAGIPDFRSASGIYEDPSKLGNLPNPQAVFESGHFAKHPEHFYKIACEIYPGTHSPTRTHAFARLLSEHGQLQLLFTQNIDMLEKRAGIPPSKLVEAHGSLGSQRCIKCKAPFEDQKMQVHIKSKKVPRCENDTCSGVVKPDIVFFGDPLPAAFYRSKNTVCEADLLLVMGTSLSVPPFNELPGLVPQNCPRVLINHHSVERLGDRKNDVELLGDCDSIVSSLCTELGWKSELDSIWEGYQHTLSNSSDPSHPKAPQKLPSKMTALDHMQAWLEMSNDDLGKDEEENKASEDEVGDDDKDEDEDSDEGEKGSDEESGEESGGESGEDSDEGSDEGSGERAKKESPDHEMQEKKPYKPRLHIWPHSGWSWKGDAKMR